MFSKSFSYQWKPIRRRCMTTPYCTLSYPRSAPRCKKSLGLRTQECSQWFNWISIQIPWSWISRVSLHNTHGSHISKLEACTVWICWLAGTSAMRKWKCCPFNPLNSDASPKTDQHLFQGTNQVVWQEQVRVSFTAWLQTLTEMTVKQILLSRECDFKTFQASAGHNSLSLLVAVLYLCAFFICMSAQTSWTWPEYQSPAPSWVVQSCGPETAKKPCTKNVKKIETVQTSSGRIKWTFKFHNLANFVWDTFTKNHVLLLRMHH